MVSVDCLYQQLEMPTLVLLEAVPALWPASQGRAWALWSFLAWPPALKERAETSALTRTEQCGSRIGIRIPMASGGTGLDGVIQP